MKINSKYKTCLPGVSIEKKSPLQAITLSRNCHSQLDNHASPAFSEWSETKLSGMEKRRGRGQKR